MMYPNTTASNPDTAVRRGRTSLVAACQRLPYVLPFLLDAVAFPFQRIMQLNEMWACSDLNINGLNDGHSGVVKAIKAAPWYSHVTVRASR